MNRLDKDYLEILRDILDNGHKKETRNGGVRSLFGKTIRHSMKDGFPILTTKKMGFKTIMTELHWFLSGRTDLKYLVDNNCYIWVGDAYKNYTKWWEESDDSCNLTEEQSNKWLKLVDGGLQWTPLSQEEFINKIKTDDEFSNKWGNLGRIYGAQWRGWKGYEQGLREGASLALRGVLPEIQFVDQIQDLINKIKANPDSRRLKVTAWNPSEIDDAILPPCHTDFQIYTRELSLDERHQISLGRIGHTGVADISNGSWHETYNETGIPKRAISLLWNQRSADFPLGIPFNIASYGALLCILGKMCNMIPEDLIGNIGDCHIYDNQIEAVNEQLGIDLQLEEEKIKLVREREYEKASQVRDKQMLKLRNHRKPFPLPTLVFNDNIKFDGTIDELLESCTPSDFKLENYQSHSAIKAPLSN